jgi:7-carboxy-7-deazaguanine synthase
MDLLEKTLDVSEATPKEARRLAQSLAISEIFRSIQGESTHAGRPCVFVRLAGCPLRCRWCDSAYAFGPGERMSLEAILERVGELGGDGALVEVTGGEPLAQPECPALLKALCDAGHEVLLETGGALDIAPVDPRAIKIVDVKCPGSGMAARNRWDNLERLGPRDEVKFVIADRADYEWARQAVAEHGLGGPRTTALFSPAWGLMDPAALAGWILEDRLDVRLQLQLHKQLWPGVERGI